MKDKEQIDLSAFILPPSSFILTGSLRPYRDGDQADLVRHANNPNVARHLRDLFPQPYTWADADQWIRRVVKDTPAHNFAICQNDQVIGGIGLVPGSDIQRVSAEVGYWIGEAFWGRGIAAAALLEL